MRSFLRYGGSEMTHFRQGVPSAVWKGGENRGLFSKVPAPANKQDTQVKTRSAIKGHLPSGVPQNSIRDRRVNPTEV